MKEYVLHWRHYLSKEARFWLSDHGKQENKKTCLKKKKPSQEPSTPKMAYLLLLFDFYVNDIKTFIWRPHGESNPGYRRERPVS